MKDFFVEEARNAKSFEASLDDIVIGFKSGKIEGWRTVRMTVDGDYKWSTVAEVCKNERDWRSLSDKLQAIRKLAEDAKPTPDVQDKTPRTYDVLLCVFGVLSLFGHFASPASIALSGLALFFWIRRKGPNVWYRIVGLVAALISLGGTALYLGAAWLVVVRTWF